MAASYSISLNFVAVNLQSSALQFSPKKILGTILIAVSYNLGGKTYDPETLFS